MKFFILDPSIKMERYIEECLACYKTEKTLEALEQDWNEAAKKCNGSWCLRMVKNTHINAKKRLCKQYLKEYKKLADLSNVLPPQGQSQELKDRFVVLKKNLDKCYGDDWWTD